MVNELLEVISHELLRYGNITKITEINETSVTIRVIEYCNNKYMLSMQYDKCIMVKLLAK